MTTTDLELYGADRSWVALRSPAMELAQYVADTAFVPKGLRGNAPAIAAAILYGDELGLGPMQSLARIAVIDGRPTLSAETQRGLVLAAGHAIWAVESTDTRVTIAGRRKGDDRTHECTWTMDTAKKAGLSGKPSYRAYPRAMLTARATAELVRLAFADVVGGLAATEEIVDGVDVDELALEAGGDGEVVAETTAKASTRRKRKSTNGPETSSAPAAQATEPDAGSDDPVDLVAELEGAEPSTELADDPVPGLAESAAADAETPALMSEPQKRKMQALFREMEVTGREPRLSYTSTVAKRKLASSSELTLAEAGAVIDALEAWKANPDGGPFQDGIPF